MNKSKGSYNEALSDRYMLADYFIMSLVDKLLRMKRRDIVNIAFKE